MEPFAHGIAIVRRAEAELRDLLLRCAGEGDYQTVRLLAELAQRIRQLCNQFDSPDSLASALRSSTEPASPYVTPNSSWTVDRRKDGNSGSRGVRRRAKQSRATKSASREYPQFFRDGDELVKLGWSKRQKTVYRHKAPKRIVLLVTHSLDRIGRNGERFQMEQILPVRDPEQDADVPSYQAYLIIAWLRKENLIVQHGRQGYSRSPTTDLTGAVEQSWNSLPTSRAS